METSRQKTERVEVYYNRRKKLFSVRENGKVTAHVNDIFLIDCTFVVQTGGQKRVRETGVRNVHAWVKGTLFSSTYGMNIDQWSRYMDTVLAIDCFACIAGWQEVSVHYNPFKLDTFVDEQGQEIRKARVTRLFFEKDRPVIIAYIEREIWAKNIGLCSLCGRAQKSGVE